MINPAAGVRRHFVGAPVTVVLTALTMAVFLADRASGHWVVHRCVMPRPGYCRVTQTVVYHVHNLTHWLGFQRSSIMQDQLWRLVTPALLNSLGWAHVSANAVSLLVFGPTCERLLGRARFLLTYLACDAAAYTTLVAAMPSHDLTSFGGSSAAIFGTFVAVFVVAIGSRQWPPGARWATVLAAGYLLAQVPLALYVPYTRTALLREIHGASISAGLLIGGVLLVVRRAADRSLPGRAIPAPAEIAG